MSVAATSSSSSSSSDRRMMAAELSSSVAAAAMDTESDDGEPRLEIVDEPMVVDGRTENDVSVRSFPPPPPIPMNAARDFVAFRKSISYDGSSVNNAESAAVAKRMRSIVEETNANEAIESLLMLGRGPVVSPQSRERSSSFSTSSPVGRRFSNSSDVSFELRPPPPADSAHASTTLAKLPTTKNGRDNFKGSMTYYQRMRERNNEASKRCRLKRRMKAETVEQQAHNLNMSNKFLRHRISRLETICVVLKDGVKRIQSKDCRCLETVARVKKTNVDCQDISNLSNRALIRSSMANRTVNADFLAEHATAGSPAAVKEELPSPPELPMVAQLQPEQPTQLPQLPPLPTTPTVEVRTTPLPPPPPVCITFPGRSELSVTPVSRVTVVTSAASSSSSTTQPKTALDVINDTIIQSLRSNSGVGGVGNVITAPCVPLNLVKVVPASSPSLNQQTPPPPPTTTTPPKQIILVTTPPVFGRQPMVKEEAQQSSGLGYAGNTSRVVVKCEPEIQIVKCEAPKANTGEGIAVGAMEDTEDEEEEGVDPSLPCIAATHSGYTSGCSGDLVNLNKLSSYLDLISRNVARDNGRAAMERAIIKSRLRVPFWQADELPTFICERHRYDIVHSSTMQACVMCNKKRSRRATSPQSIMMTITYRMSLENYTTTGKILPIGLLVCSHCKEKQLRGLDFTNSQVIGPTDFPVEPTSSSSSSSSAAAVSICPVAEKRPATFGSGKEDSNVIIHPVVRQKTQQSVKVQASSTGHPVQPQPQTSQSNGNGVLPSPLPDGSAASSHPPPPENIFTKIGRLNEALQAINPKYRPTGFSITSIESCSKSVLEDATLAAETAVSTLLSVIAPRNEAFIWESIKPKLDAKFLQQHDVPQEGHGSDDNPMQQA